MSSAKRITSFERAGLTFDVIDTGPIDGPPVVLLHGFPQRASAWAGVSELLHAAGLRTYALDQRGYSPGARPKRVRDYRMRELVADVVTLIEHIGTPVHVVGHDWGAAVAWALTWLHKDKVATLTAVSVGHTSAFLRSMVVSGQGLQSYYMQIFSVPVLSERLLSKRGGWGERFFRNGGSTDEAYEEFHRDIVDAGALTGGLNWYRALPLSLAEKRSPVEVPTTFVWSDEDRALGRKQAELTANYVRGPYEFVEMTAVSHWILGERPAELADAIVRRVRSVDAGSAV
ncbi:MAG: alpha/beta fold hydrolase [Nocardiaceae bacterium]|nr:alpha/beta fold hydrolase [Nocardiaceae bacterium]